MAPEAFEVQDRLQGREQTGGRWVLLPRPRTLENLAPPFFAVTVCSALSTISVCAALARIHKDLPAWMYLPQISLLGCRPPARYCFQVGMMTTAIFAAASMAIYGIVALRVFAPPGRGWLRCGLALAEVGLGGLFVVGLFPVQENCMDMVAGTAGLARQTIVHGTGATTFFFGTWLHGIVTLRAYRMPGAPSVVHTPTMRALFRTRQACLASPFAAMVLQLIISPLLSERRLRYQVGAIQQWIAIGSMLGLLVTLLVDTRVFAASQGFLAPPPLGATRE